MKTRQRLWILAGCVALAASSVSAQDRDTKVRNDRTAFSENDSWIYNDLNQALAEAKASGKPVLAVIRCIP